MPNGPSMNALNKTITFKRWSPIPQDADAGAQAPGTAYTTIIAKNVPCGLHLQSSTEVIDDTNRATMVNSWAISLGQYLALNVNDEGVFTLDGVTHTVFVQGSINRSGRDKAYKVMCAERL